MKKLLVLGLVFVVLALALCGCGSNAEEFVCDYCDATVTETPNNVTYIGQEMKVCSECEEVIDQLNDTVEQSKENLEDFKDQLEDMF